MVDIISLFKSWTPSQPTVLQRTRNSVELSFSQPEPFKKLEATFLYRLQTNTKLLGWVNVYCGGKSSKIINNLQPGRSHKFRLQIILRLHKLSSLINIRHLDHKFNKNETHLTESIAELVIYKKNNNLVNENINERVEEKVNNDYTAHEINDNNKTINDKENNINSEFDNKSKGIKDNIEIISKIRENLELLPQALNNVTTDKTIESQWSEEVQSSTDSEGPSVVCFCMAVRCGYMKQVQSMLDERPDLIDICNTTDGFTPLATAVRKGNVQMVRYLLNAGADINQRSSTSQTPLHLAILSGNVSVAEILTERGADITARDRNGLSLMHYAVDSQDLPMVRYVLKEANASEADNKGWTPLHRAVIQGASTPIVQELLNRGCNVDQSDHRGLTCPQLASLLKKRDDIRRLVDKNFIHDKAVINFTKLTKKLSTIHSLMHK